MVKLWQHLLARLRGSGYGAHQSRSQRLRRNARRRRPSVARWLPVIAALCASVVFLGLSDAGRSVRRADPLIIQLDRLAAGIGLGIQAVSLTGHDMTPDRDIFDALDLESTHSLFAFDAAAARQRIEQLSWIQEARIHRTFPHRIDVAIREREPFAVWLHNKREALIDRDGRLLAHVRAGAVRDLPLVRGSDAPANVAELFDTLAARADLLRRVAVSEFVDGRRWTLHLDDGGMILLPELQYDAALAVLVKGKRGRRLIDQSRALVDLRVPGLMVYSPISSKRRRTRRAGHVPKSGNTQFGHKTVRATASRG